jgi:cytochrome c
MTAPSTRSCFSRTAATSGDDARIGIWTPGEQTPRTVLEGHRAPVAALAVSADGSLLASASWDHTARLWPLGGGTSRVLEGHSQNVNGIAFTPDGRAVVTAGYDATLRIWPLAGDDAPAIVTLPTPLNAVAVAPDGEIITAGAD